MAETVVLWVTAGEPETGIWCDRCLTSATVRVPLYVMGASGFSPVGQVVRCTRCDLGEPSDPDALS
jgi:hypothetical protein